MNELEKYIRGHAAEFDAATPAEGHEARFLARLDATPLPKQTVRPARRSNWFGRLKRIAWVPAFACAALAAVLVLRPGDPFRRAGNDPAAIYHAYLDQVAQIYLQTPGEDCVGRDVAIQGLTEEEEPFFDQLPPEYSPRKRARILKEYYGDLLSRAQEINNLFIN